MAGPIPGKVSRLEFDGEAVGGRVDMTLNLEKGEIDGSHMDSQDWSDFLHGRKSATIDFSLRYIEDDPGQTKLIDNYFASQETETNADITFRQQTGTGLREFTCAGFVTSLTINAADEAPQDMNGTIRITGPVVDAEQSNGGVEG